MDWNGVMRVAYIPRISTFAFLIMGLRRSGSATGISGHSQVLFAVALTARYADLFEGYGYDCVLMRISVLRCSYYVIYLIFGKYRHTRDISEERLPVTMALVIGSAFLALVFPRDNSIYGIAHPLSKFLESVAMVPQLFLSRTCPASHGGLTGFVTRNLLCRSVVTVLYLCHVESGWPLTHPAHRDYNRVLATHSRGHTIVANLPSSQVPLFGGQSWS